MKVLFVFAIGIALGLSQKVDFSQYLHSDSTPVVDLPKINLHELEYKRSLEINSTLIKLQNLQVELEQIGKEIEELKEEVKIIKDQV